MGLFDLLRGDSPDAFAKLMVAQLEKRGWPDRLRYDKARFLIELGGRWGDYRLDNVYPEWLRYPSAQRKAAIAQLVDGLFDTPPPDTYEEAAPLLLPMIRNRAQLSNGSYRFEPESPEPFDPPPMRPLAHLAVLAALDRPGSIMLVDEDLLRTWDKTFEEVLDRAIANLRAREQRPFRQLSDKLFASDFQDYHDLARLLAPELFSSLPFKGAPIAVAAARSWLVVADSEDAIALEKLARFVEATVEDDPRAISYAPLRLDGEGWVAVGADVTDHLALRRLAVKQSTWDYSAQKELLEAQGAVPGGATSIASQEVWVDGENGQTTCTWTEESNALLPRSDLVVLRRSDGDSVGVKWTDIGSIIGTTVEISGCYPPLYRPPPWPGDDQWTALSDRARALGWTAA